MGYMDVSKNRGTPKSSILIRFSIINHAFWGTRIFGNIHRGTTWNPCGIPVEVFFWSNWNQKTHYESVNDMFTYMNGWFYW